jgi:phosphatidylserine/phosphatidylglycerophosphate/cardiolipin synthase-like enzyme
MNFSKITDSMGPVLKHFGPQSDGSFSNLLAYTVPIGSQLYAPTNCTVRYFKDHAGEAFLALELDWDQEIIKVLTVQSIYSEIPTHLCIKQSDSNGSNYFDFVGFANVFLRTYLAKKPRSERFNPDDPADVALALSGIMQRGFPLSFKTGELIGLFLKDTLEISAYTTWQIRPMVTVNHTNRYWPEIERRNLMDPIAWLNGFVFAHQKGLATFQTQSDYDIINNWFTTNNLNNRLLVEFRDEYNVPIVESSEKASEIMITWNTVSSTLMSFSDALSHTTDITTSTNGYFAFTGAKAKIDIETKFSTNAVYSELDHQHVFGDLLHNSSFVKKTKPDSIIWEAPKHLVIQILRPSDWFAPQLAVHDNNNISPLDYPEVTTPLKRYTIKNKAETLIDGLEYFKSFKNEVELVSEDTHFIHLAAWSIDVNFDLFSNSGITLRQLLSGKLTKVRLLAWDNITPPLPRISFSNMSALNYINGFDYGDDFAGFPKINTPVRAILDNRQDISLKSANHMKLAVINNSRALIAYCGGIDIWPDRSIDAKHLTSTTTFGLHDTMIKLTGEAAFEINRVLYKRWIDATINNIPAKTPNKETFRYYSYNGNHDEGTVLVQIACTIDSSVKLTRKYAFAVGGDNTIYRTLVKSIENARSFIYIEDQYFRDQNIINALETALQRGVYVVVVMPDVLWDGFLEAAVTLPELFDPNTDFNVHEPQEITQHIRDTYLDKFKIFGLRNKSDRIYVHSKLWIVDDIFLSCGSANIDTKGMGSDPNAATSCECNGFYIDEMIAHSGSRIFARDLRIRLWSEHLFEQPISPEQPVESSVFFHALVDPIKAIATHWNTGKRIVRLT